MKLRAAQKIAIGFVLVTLAVVFGYKFITDSMVLREKFPEIAPGNATLLGIDPGAGFRIVVANRIAGLVQGAMSEYDQGGTRSDSGDAEEAKKKQLSIRDMITILQGNDKALGRFVMFMNDIRRNDRDWPTVQIYWDAAEIDKALNGDAALLKKLETDLNVRMDGTPLTEIRLSSLENGIVIRLPVTVDVRVGSEPKKLVGIVEQPFRPRFAKTLIDRLYQDKFDVTNATLKGYYLQDAQATLAGKLPKEDVANALARTIDKERITQMAVAPSKVLSSARIILNDNFIESAEYTKNTAANGKELFTLSLQLSDEGRRRLWQYSKLYQGTQLLFVVNGVAISAPWVRQEIPGSEVTITNLTDEELVQEAVQTINQRGKEK